MASKALTGAAMLSKAKAIRTAEIIFIVCSFLSTASVHAAVRERLMMANDITHNARLRDDFVMTISAQGALRAAHEAASRCSGGPCVAVVLQDMLTYLGRSANKN